MTILIALLVIIGILLLLAAIQSNEYLISRETVINKSCKDVFDYVRQLKNGDYFNKWIMADPTMKKTYAGTDGTVGFIYAWDSENKQVGKGEQEIKAIKEGERIDYEIRFIKPFEGVSGSYITTESVSPTETSVTWYFLGKKNLMLKVMHLYFGLEKVLGNDLAASLKNLKGELEK
jgi:hypothetical protein